MQIEVPDSYLVGFCGGDWGTQTATNLRVIVMDYLYGKPDSIGERKTLLGLMLVDVLEHKLKE